MFKWQRCIKIPTQLVYESQEEYKNRLPDEDNLPKNTKSGNTTSGACYFVPYDTSAIIVGWYSEDWRKFVPRGAKKEDKMYDPKEILFWSHIDESHISE